MDAWLAAIGSDTSNKAFEQKVVSNRPTTANDRCATSDGTGLTMSQCTGFFGRVGSHGNRRRSH